MQEYRILINGNYGTIELWRGDTAIADRGGPNCRFTFEAGELEGAEVIKRLLKVFS